LPLRGGRFYKRVMRPLLLAALPVFLLDTGCGLISSDFTADVSFTAEIDDPANYYRDFVIFDPNDSSDFAENKDRIKRGKIRKITVAVVDVVTEEEAQGTNELVHRAKIGIGQIDVRAVPEGTTEPPSLQMNSTVDTPWIEAVARWRHSVPLVPTGDAIELELNQTVLNRVHALLFERKGPMEVRFVGFANESPVNFVFEVNIELEFTADVI